MNGEMRGTFTLQTHQERFCMPRRRAKRRERTFSLHHLLHPERPRWRLWNLFFFGALGTSPSLCSVVLHGGFFFQFIPPFPFLLICFWFCFARYASGAFYWWCPLCSIATAGVAALWGLLSYIREGGACNHKNEEGFLPHCATQSFLPFSSAKHKNWFLFWALSCAQAANEEDFWDIHNTIISPRRGFQGGFLLFNAKL